MKQTAPSPDWLELYAALPDKRREAFDTWARAALGRMARIDSRPKAPRRRLAVIGIGEGPKANPAWLGRLDYPTEGDPAA